MNKKLSYIILCILLPMLIVAQPKFSDTLNIATFNIRIGVASDTGYRDWNLRKSYVGNFINEYKLDFLGIQEILDIKQENDLMQYLPIYNVYSKGRENDLGTIGERVAIVYNKSRFKTQDSGYFFLAENPKKSTMGWDAACKRMCIWLKMKDVISKKTFFVFCTHFDHIGVEARKKSAELIVEQIKLIAGKNPIFFMGDLNMPPTEKSTYDILNQYLKNSRTFSMATPKGSVGTFNDWKHEETSFPDELLIDYIFFNQGKVLSYEAVDKRYLNKAFLSDHLPIYIKYHF